MTRDALILRDNSSVPARHTPTVLARVAAEILARASHAGVDGKALLRHAALSASAVNDPDGRVPLVGLYALLEGMESLSGDPFLHLRVSPDFDFGSLDALGFLVMSSPTLAEGLRAMLRYQKVWNDGERYEITSDGEWTRIVYIPWGKRRRAHALLAEMFVADMLLNAGNLTGGPFEDPRALFVHAAPADRQLHRRLLAGIAAEFGCPRDELWIRSRDLDRPVATAAQRGMFAFFERHLQAEVRRLPSEGAAARARDLLLQRPELASSAKGIASALHLSSRTLQRQLAAEGTTLRALADDTRRARALTLLDAGQSIAEVAALLGYTTSAFHRSFRRWAGCTPRDYRARRKPRPAN